MFTNDFNVENSINQVIRLYFKENSQTPLNNAPCEVTPLASCGFTRRYQIYPTVYWSHLTTGLFLADTVVELTLYIYIYSPLPDTHSNVWAGVSAGVERRKASTWRPRRSRHLWDVRRLHNHVRGCHDSCVCVHQRKEVLRRRLVSTTMNDVIGARDVIDKY